MLDFVRPRGEFASLLVVAALLTFAAPRVARLCGGSSRRVGDLYWNAGVAFVVGGRVGYLAVESPRSLIDPLVAVRIQGGVDPLVGALAAAAVLAWHARRLPLEGRASALSAWGLGLALATIGYDLACPLRDACYGAPAPAPLGFFMSGLADTRVATPLVEAAALLLGLGLLVRWWPRWSAGGGVVTIGLVAGVRLALVPLAVSGWDGPTLEALALALTVAAAVAGVIVLSSLPSLPSQADGVPPPQPS